MDKTPFTIAAERANESGWRQGAQRMIVEGRIARKVVDAILAAGYRVGVHDGEEMVLKDSTSVNDAMQALFSTDEDRVYAFKDGKPFGWVYLVYGNSGYDLVSDYTTNLEDIMKPVNEYADSIEGF